MKFKIESDGTPFGTTVYLVDAEGGLTLLPGVVSVSVHGRVGIDVVHADVELQSCGIDGTFLGDIIGVPAQVIEAARQVAQTVRPPDQGDAQVVRHLHDVLANTGFLTP